MKICFMSDIHGDFPKSLVDKVDIVAIAGDIFPLGIQNDMVKCIVWFTDMFVPWCMALDCEKVLLVAGNHDFMFQKIVQDYYRNSVYRDNKKLIEFRSADIVKERLMFPNKIVYLQDTTFSFNHINFYGTPWCPDLKNWAFYKNHEELEETFNEIPKYTDVLISHAPGYENEMGTSHFTYGTKNFGCKELTDRVLNSNIKLWVAGHVHTGNHEETLMSNGRTTIVNVSLKNEDYNMTFEPKIIEI